LRRHKDAFERLGGRVVLVGLGGVQETAAFKKQFEVPFDMIADPDKRLFKAFRLKRASTGSFLSAKMAAKGLMAMAKGHRLGMPQGDVRQLPGVFIIDIDGHILFSHHAVNPADHPQPETLLAALGGESST